MQTGVAGHLISGFPPSCFITGNMRVRNPTIILSQSSEFNGVWDLNEGEVCFHLPFMIDKGKSHLVLFKSIAHTKLKPPARHGNQIGFFVFGVKNIGHIGKGRDGFPLPGKSGVYHRVIG